MPATHTADFQTAAVKATNLDAVEKINVGIETDKVRKHLNIVADAPEIRIQDKTGSAPEVNATTMAIVADGGATHFRAGTTTFAEGAETKGNVKFQSSTGATTHAEIVGSSGKLELHDGGLGLKRGSNVTASGTSSVIQEITGPHARESAVLKKYPEVVFADGKFEYNDASNTYTQGGYVVTSSSNHSSTHRAENAFDGNPSTFAHTGTVDTYGGANYAYDGTNSLGGISGYWLKLKLPHKIKVSRVNLRARSGFEATQAPKDFTFIGSNDDTNWTTIQAFTGQSPQDDGSSNYNITSDPIAYKYLAIVITRTVASANASFSGLEYYGYEEVGAGDDSVDTTVKSVYNAPDLTSAALYIDATKPDSNESVTDQSGSGVTVTATGVTHDSTENVWELTGAATSNIVSGNLASLVGDHPHSVSAWVKADQLNGSGLFHVGTAEGEGDAASRVGFVDDSHISWGGEDHYFSSAEWHNVTYTYNGEGSGKKLFLDGRLVGSAKNEDTFGEYPPFAMSNYSQYGYTVSASSEYPGTDYLAHEAFNKTHADNGDCWLSADATYDGSTGNYNGSANLGSDSGGTAFANADKGEWLKMEMPHKLVLEYIDIVGSTASGVNPKDWKIYGSNDDKNWDVLLSKTNTVTAAYNDTVNRIHTVSATRAYKYLALVVTKSGGLGSGTHYTQVGELRFFGHRENDLVRFPDSVNTLKYPHVDVGVPRDNPAKRGYVVTTGTSIFSGRTGARAFDDQPIGDGWETNNNSYNLSSSGVAVSGDSFVDQGSGGSTYTGHWIKLQLPRKIRASAIEIKAFSNSASTSDDRRPDAGAFLGSNDNTNWYLLHEFTSGSLSWSLRSDGTTTYETSVNSLSASNTNAYKYIVMVITNKTYGGSVTTSKTSIRHLRYYGTEPGDVVARVGDGFDGKIRNLRVYSTALSDARVQEIFDADKDEFGLAKSSVSVYRGRLGVGTTEPKAALTVMDEVGELIQLPPGNMTAHDQYFEKHGVFKARTSPGHNTGNYPPWEGFNDTIGTLWYTGYSDSSASYNGTSGAYSGTAQLGSTTKLGEYLVLEMPYKVFPKRMEYIRQSSGSHLITNAYVYGRNGSNGIWTEIGSFTDGGPPDDWVPKVVHLNNSEPYDQLAFVPTKRYAASTSAGVSCHLVRYFGTREQGASTLHNGELSLTRNLTVPRIGPPLDADDTPRRDRLVVEYNTSTNPTENGVVNDTSGRGLDGLLDNTYGGAAYNPYYDANEKALVFDGSNDYVFQNDVHLKTGVGGTYSASVWVRNRATSGTQTVYSLGTYAQLTTSTLYVLDTTLQVVFYNSDLSVTYTIPKNTWTHIVVTHAGGPTSTTTKMYINGVDVGLAAVSGTAYPLSTVNFPSPCNLFLGKNSDNSVYGGPMDLSNFKLYDVALTADEVKRLYNMGWCDEGHHVVNFSKTRVGIGLGDGEAPQAALDVRDLSEIKQLGVGMNGTGTHRPSIAPLSVCKDTFDELGGGIELMRTNTPEGNSGLGFNRGSAIWHAHKSSTNRETLYFAIGGGNYGTSSYDYNRVRGYFDTNNGGGNITFTGQHRAVVEGTPLHETEKYQGLIVSAKNNKYVKLNNGIETGSSAITINESVPLVSLSSVAQDKSCFGVISDSEDPDVREDRIGNFVTTGQKEKGDHRWFINSVGEGAIWVADINGPLESGDYITTSNIAGYGQKQDGAGLMNYTVAKITMDCDFEPATQPIQRIKQSNVVETHYTGLVQVAKSVPHEFVTTVVSADDAWSNVSISPSDVTYAEWSNLESNVQNTYTLEYTSTSNVVYDVKYTKTTTANVTAEDAWDAVHVDPPEVTYAEYSNLEANVQNTYSLTFTRTTTEEKTPSEWSALDANAQALWSVRYYDTVEQNVDADYPGAVAHDTVTDKLENDLDEHGQIQWEDTEETEKAYKIRYLDASGQQTDEANAVHRAAFVGCTYHCG